MSTLSNVLGGKNPLAQMKDLPSTSVNTARLGDPIVSADMVYNPTQRVSNQMRTSSQVQNYAASKAMAEQGRTDMRGNVVGYADTLG